MNQLRLHLGILHTEQANGSATKVLLGKPMGALCHILHPGACGAASILPVFQPEPQRKSSKCWLEMMQSLVCQVSTFVISRWDSKVKTQHLLKQLL